MEVFGHSGKLTAKEHGRLFGNDRKFFIMILMVLRLHICSQNSLHHTFKLVDFVICRLYLVWRFIKLNFKEVLLYINPGVCCLPEI